MKNYWVYAEFFGRKVKIKVFAKSEDEAKQKVKDKIIVHKLEPAPEMSLLKSWKQLKGLEK